MLALVGEGVGVGEVLTETVVLRLEKMLPPKARYNENKDNTPSTPAAMILFLSVGVFPAKIFINLILLKQIFSKQTIEPKCPARKRSGGGNMPPIPIAD